jgi:hypothetical protein
MKKLFALILLGVMLLGMGACKPKSDDSQGQGQTTGQQNSPLQRNTDDPFAGGGD